MRRRSKAVVALGSLLTALACGRSEVYALDGLAESSGSTIGGGGTGSSTGRASGSGGSTTATVTGTRSSGTVTGSSTHASTSPSGSGTLTGTVTSTDTTSGGRSSSSRTTTTTTTTSTSGSGTLTGTTNTGHSSSSRTTTATSSTSGSGLADAGCSDSKQAVELAPCQVATDCGCPLGCTTDLLVGTVCEYPCQQTADCPTLLTACIGGFCRLNQCGSATGNGSFNSLCDVIGLNDGTCVPFQYNGTITGLCYQGGTATSACNPTANRTDLSADCIAGDVCVGGAIGSGGFCGLACTPNGPNTCPPRQGCAITVNDPTAGACVPF